MLMNDYVWYAAYGSNLYYERFLCYIRGGTPSGSGKCNCGCRDKTMPVDNRLFIFHNELYFARESVSWGRGGVAFIDSRLNPKQKTYGRIYCITGQQFEDFVCQENDINGPLSINYQELELQKSIYFDEHAWYGKLIFLGIIESYPVYTITSATDNLIARKPSPEYLSVIIKGLKQTGVTDSNQIIEYLAGKSGIKEYYNITSLTEIVKFATAI